MQIARFDNSDKSSCMDEDRRVAEACSQCELTYVKIPQAMVKASLRLYDAAIKCFAHET